MRIQSLWRHPVKSLQGQPMGDVVVAAQGVVGDRAWGVRDVATGAVLSAKREPRLLLAAAAALGEGVAVTVPGCAGAGGAAADRLLSEWVGRAVRLDLAQEAPYVDEADIHLVTTAELGAWDARRFRPNVVVESAEPLDGLVGERLRLGDSVVCEVVKRTKRCAMPTMRQPGLARDVDVLRALARGRDLRLGVYARVVTPGPVAVDMAVRPV